MGWPNVYYKKKSFNVELKTQWTGAEPPHVTYAGFNGGCCREDACCNTAGLGGLKVETFRVELQTCCSWSHYLSQLYNKLSFCHRDLEFALTKTLWQGILHVLKCCQPCLVNISLFIFSRRWFSIQKNQLVYQKKFKVIFFFFWTTCTGSCTTRVRQILMTLVVVQEQPTVVVEDLRLCTVKTSAENERRFCFEVVSPSKWACVAVCVCA